MTTYGDWRYGGTIECTECMGTGRVPCEHPHIVTWDSWQECRDCGAERSKAERKYPYPYGRPDPTDGPSLIAPDGKCYPVFRDGWEGTQPGQVDRDFGYHEDVARAVTGRSLDDLMMGGWVHHGWDGYTSHYPRMPRPMSDHQVDTLRSIAAAYVTAGRAAGAKRITTAIAANADTVARGY